MAKEVFQITEDTGEWHIQGVLPEDDYRAARLLNIAYDVASRKVHHDRHLNVVVVNPALPFADNPNIG